MKRILCILYGLTAGGAETFMMKICRSLPKDKYKIDFIVSEANGCYEKEALDLGCLIHRIPKRKENFFVALNSIRKIVKEHNYQCVLKLGDNPIAVLDLIAARLGGAKRLAMRSCNALSNLSKKQKCVNAIFRPILNWITDIKFAPSMLAAEFTFGKRLAHKDVHLIHNGVDLNQFHFDNEGRERIRNEFLIGDKFVIGHIGRFHKQKNHHFLLEIFHDIHQYKPDSVLLLVGIGELEDEIKEQINELGLRDAVILAGQRFDIPQVLSAMDVFVFPSFYEGMPNTVIEAQATGLPCIIADTITREANITGLVQYLPLENTDKWVQTVLDMNTSYRLDTADQFIAHKYNIESVVTDFIETLLK